MQGYIIKHEFYLEKKGSKRAAITGKVYRDNIPKATLDRFKA
jgi:hypothetical protein